MKSLKKLAYLLGIYTGFNIVSLQPVVLVTIVTYILTENNEISADKVFYAIAIFNTLLTTCMYFIPQAVMGISAASVTLKRLEVSFTTKYFTNRPFSDWDKKLNINPLRFISAVSTLKITGRGLLVNDIVAHVLQSSCHFRISVGSIISHLWENVVLPPLSC